MKCIISKELTAKAYNDVKNLVQMSKMRDQSNVKLELESKIIVANIDDKIYEFEIEDSLKAYKELSKEDQSQNREFFCYDGEVLVGYIGIALYGNSPLEVNGLVHPDYRRKGIFSSLFELVKMTWGAMGNRELLLITDHISDAGQAFVQKQKGVLSHSEFDMYLSEIDTNRIIQGMLKFRRATNKDASEIAYQNSLYFCIEYDETTMTMPENDALRGIQVYMIEYENQIIGKVHLQLIDEVGMIYGLGVLPRYRGSGYGKIALEKSVERLANMGAKLVKLQVEAENEKALKLYESAGFKISGAMDYYRFIQ